jgi:hypothetical protein|tara:strand:- start:498 stop:653 length:156 start_codon:yes stop_codon:yes gene_type:complete
MNEIKSLIVSFVEALPPLLQLILGMAVAIGAVKIMIALADKIEAKKNKKKS